MTGEPLIDYEALTQNAMRSVVKSVLSRTATSGLPGDHHFYISFDTQADGVSVSKRLREKYPHEMTIVLQHRFWDLNVYDERFEVKLTFDGIPERLVVPYEAIKVFFDPSVRYGLQFEEPDFNADAIDRSMSPIEMSDLIRPESDPTGATPASIADGPARPASTRKRKPRSAPNTSDETVDEPPAIAEEKPAPRTAAKTKKRDGENTPAAATAEAGDGADQSEDAENSAGAEIVSLDAFRKK